MPNNKKSKNSRYTGFYWYMQELMPTLKLQGRAYGGIEAVVPVARPMWKALTKQEQDRYDKIAKEMKKKEGQNTFGLPTYRDDSQRLDNVGNIIAHRVDKGSVQKEQRSKDRKWASSRWPAEIQGINSMLDQKFYFIGFEYLCKLEDGEYLPCELAMLEWSMRHGISKTFHKFIDAGGIPVGYRYTCQQHSEETHQIPIEDFEDADGNYREIWEKMLNFVNPHKEAKDTPPIYCGLTQFDAVESMITFLHNHACIAQPNILNKLFVVEDCLQDLAAKVDVHISDGSSADALLSTVFDYEADTRCKWHDDKEVRNCALLTVKRFAYILSDFCSTEDKYNFLITPNHLPIRDSKYDHNIVIPANRIAMDAPSRGRGRGRGNSSDGARAVGNAWNKPRAQEEDHGIFASRDIRYLNKAVEKVVIDTREDEEDEDLESMYSYSSRQTSATNFSTDPYAPKAPWGTSAGNHPYYKPNIGDDDEFPSLGGGPAKPKFVERSASPTSSVSSVNNNNSAANKIWQPSTAYLERRNEQEEERARQPSLMDMVRQKEQAEKQQQSSQGRGQQNPSVTGVGRGFARSGAAPSGNPWLPSNSSSTSNAGIGRGGWNPRPQGSSASAAPNPWGAGAKRGGETGGGNPSSAAQSQAPVNMSMAGVGRGRGIIAAAATEPVVRPPPGFGRGLMSGK